MAKSMAVNKAGNYTKPTMRKKIFSRIKSVKHHMEQELDNGVQEKHKL